MPDTPPPPNPQATLPVTPPSVTPAAGDFNYGGSQAQSKLASELERMFPGGNIPDGGRSNKESDMMREAGRASSIEAAAATPPGSTINTPNTAPQGVPIVAPTVVVPPAQPAAPTTPITQPAVQPTTPAAPTPEEKAAAEAAKTAEAIKAAAEIKKPIDDAARDAAQAAMTPQAGTAFKNLRQDLSVAKEAIAAKERELADYKKQISEALPTTEAAKLKEQLKQTQDRLAIFDYRATDEYQSQVAQPLTNVEADIVALATKNQVPEADLQAALNDADPNRRSDRLAELSSNFNRLDLNRFDKLIGAREDFQGYGKQLEAQAAEKLKNYSQAQQADQTQAQEAAKADWTRALDTTYTDLSKRMPIFTPTGDAQFDADMAAKIEGVRAIDLSKLSNEQIAEVFYRDAAFDLVLGLVTNLHNKNVELDTRVRQLSGTAAPAGGGSPSTAAPTTPQFGSMQEAVRSLPQILP